MVDTKDILLKAAEDVQSGMHCKGDYFANGATAPSVLLSVIGRNNNELDQALKARRCAMGSIAVATALLGGMRDDYEGAIEAVARSIAPGESETVGVIAYYNDYKLPDDPFEAGQQLAELFRQTAETLR